MSWRTRTVIATGVNSHGRKGALLWACLLVAIGYGLVRTDLRADSTPSATTPARLDGTTASLRTLAIFPKGDGDVSALLFCHAIVQANGWLKTPRCLRRDDSRTELERSVVRAARKARAQPATVQDEPVEVFVNFSVLFDRYQGKESIDVYLHQFADFDRFGTDYTEPQVRLRAPWSGVCRPKGIVWAAYTIDAFGKARDVAVSAGRSDKSCVAFVEERVLSSDYIPAFHKGRPVPGTVREPFYLSLVDLAGPFR